MIQTSSPDQAVHDIEQRHGLAYLRWYELGLEAGERWADDDLNGFIVRRFHQLTRGVVPRPVPSQVERLLEAHVLAADLPHADAVTAFCIGFADAVDVCRAVVEGRRWTRI